MSQPERTFVRIVELEFGCVLTAKKPSEVLLTLAQTIFEKSGSSAATAGATSASSTAVEVNNLVICTAFQLVGRDGEGLEDVHVVSCHSRRHGGNRPSSRTICLARIRTLE